MVYEKDTVTLRPVCYMEPLVIRVLERFCLRWAHNGDVDISYLKSDIEDIRFVIEHLDLRPSNDQSCPDVLSLLQSIVSREEKNGNITDKNMKSSINDIDDFLVAVYRPGFDFMLSYNQALENTSTWYLLENPLKFWSRYEDIYYNYSKPSKRRNELVKKDLEYLSPIYQ